MNDQSRHLLSPEERALAARLARLGPQGDPSPALDAKILAAARAAATAPQSRRRRRFMLAGLPASLITAAGTAAALVLAVGLVWQLRPADRPPLPRDGAPGTSDDGFVIAEIVTRRPAANAAGNPSAAPAATSPSQRQMVSSREATPGGMPSRRSTPAAVPVMTPPIDSRATASTAATSHAAPPAAASAAPPPHALESVEVTGSRIPARAGSDASDAFAGDEHPHSRSETEAAAGAADSAERRHASYTTAALAKAERASRARQGGATTQSSPAATSTASAGTASAPLAEIPVEVDAKLPPADWLHRIRERRDQGDLAGARRSLHRFREVHPGVRIPFDLRRLLR